MTGRRTSAKGTASETYVVELAVAEALDSDWTVYGIPAVGSLSSFAITSYGSTYNLWVEDVNCDQPENGVRKVTFQVSYSKTPTPSGGGSGRTTYPWEQTTRVTGSGAIHSVGSFFDARGKPILNSAGDPPLVPPERDMTVTELTFKRFRHIDWETAAELAKKFNNKVNKNQETILGIIALEGTALANYSFEGLVFGPPEGHDQYVSESITISIKAGKTAANLSKKDTWADVILDQGVRYVGPRSSGGWAAGKVRMRVRDNKGAWVGRSADQDDAAGVPLAIPGVTERFLTTPFLLNGNGRPLTGMDEAPTAPASHYEQQDAYNPGTIVANVDTDASSSAAVFLKYWFKDEEDFDDLELDYNLP